MQIMGAGGQLYQLALKRLGYILTCLQAETAQGHSLWNKICSYEETCFGHTTVVTHDPVNIQKSVEGIFHTKSKVPLLTLMLFQTYTEHKKYIFSHKYPLHNSKNIMMKSDITDS